MRSGEITELADALGKACRRRGVVLAVAESCTGGAVAEAITRIPGCTRWFDRGYVTYSNEAKIELLGVAPATLDRFGAVSEAVAREMAVGALQNSRADASVAITGIAGPSGGSAAKPVGMVWLAWAGRDGGVQAREFRFTGDREAIRCLATRVALQGLADLLR